MIVKMVKVLVAEDDAFLSSLIVRDLVAVQLDSRAAYDGVQALATVKSWRPDLVLLDLLMPNKDGFEVLEAIRADPEVAATRVVIMSNLGDAETIERVKKFDVLAHFVKADTTPREVVARVKDFLK